MAARAPFAVIGNGMAGIRLVEEMLGAGIPGRDIAVFGAEPGGAYNRILLTPYLAGEIAAETLIIRDRAWYAENGITLYSSTRVVSVDRAAHTLTTSDGIVFGYGKLVLATGSQPILLPLPGADLDGIVGYRDRADTDRLMMAADKGGKAVVIGGGLLGLEAANGLAKRGMDVTVVHLMGHLMERQLDAAAGAMLRQQIEALGIRFELSASTAAFEGQDHVTGVRLADGRVLPAELVVVACGIRPEITLAKAAGLACGRGLVVDDQMGTSDADVLAVGECAEHRGRVYGLVAPLYDQAKVAAATLAGRHACYEGSSLATSLKISGVDLYSAGAIEAGEGQRAVVMADAARGLYRKLVLEGARPENERLVGAVLLGAVADGPWYAGLIRDGVSVAPFRAQLPFGRAYAEREEAA